MEASLALRLSCKLDETDIRDKIKNLLDTWKSLDNISQEQMTRLRVSAVFHRTMEEQCIQLKELKETIEAESESESREEQLLRLRLHMLNREQLIVEIGRMVRLGKLLRSRLKEPFGVDSITYAMNTGCVTSHLFLYGIFLNRKFMLYFFLVCFVGKLTTKRIQQFQFHKISKVI